MTTATASPHLTSAEIHAARIACQHCVLKHIGQARALYGDWARNGGEPIPFSHIDAIMLLGRSYVLATECLKGYPQHYAFAVGLAACAEDLCLPNEHHGREILHYRSVVESALRSSDRYQIEWDLVEMSFSNACAMLGTTPVFAQAVGHVGEALDEGEGLPMSAYQAISDARFKMFEAAPAKHVASLLTHAAHQITGGMATA